MAVKAYTSPGVNVEETSNPALAPLLSTPQVIALVGPADGLQVGSERVVLTDTSNVPDAITLSHTGISGNSATVKLASTGETINHGNWTVAQSSDPDNTVTGDEIFTITRTVQPATAPTAAAGSATGLTGTYVYAVSFVNANGETGIGPVSASVTVTDQKVNLTAIPTGSGTPTVTARNIYRAKVVNTVTGPFYHVATISDNVTTTLTGENTDDVTAATLPTPVTGLVANDVVIVGYNYTDTLYYEPTTFDDYDDLADKYGDPFNADGSINSELTYLASLAFNNGVSEVVGVATSSDDVTGYSSALSKLENEQDVRFVVVASSNSSVHSLVNAHVVAMNNIGNYRQGIVGRDSTVSAIPASTLRSQAQSYNTEGMLVVSPANFRITNPITGNSFGIGGNYVAGAIAGMFAARDVYIPLTRKVVAGIDAVVDKRTNNELAQDSQAGLFVVYNNNGIPTVRHSITTAALSASGAEASVVRAKYELAHRLRLTLDSNVVGQVYPIDDAPLLVQSVVQGVLDQLVFEGIISKYQDVKARLLDSDPTSMEVRFQYTPRFPINNIDVKFFVNTNTGTFTLGA